MALPRLAVLTIIVACAPVVGCATSTAPASAAHTVGVVLTTNAGAYRAGDVVGVLVRNRNAETLQVGGFCDRPLERWTGDEWVTVSQAGGACTAALILVLPARSVTISYGSSAVLSPGRYRLRAHMLRPGATAPFFAYSNEFGIATIE